VTGTLPVETTVEPFFVVLSLNDDLSSSVVSLVILEAQEAVEGRADCLG